MKNGGGTHRYVHKITLTTSFRTSIVGDVFHGVQKIHRIVVKHGGQTLPTPGKYPSNGKRKLIFPTTLGCDMLVSGRVFVPKKK